MVQHLIVRKLWFSSCVRFCFRLISLGETSGSFVKTIRPLLLPAHVCVSLFNILVYFWRGGLEQGKICLHVNVNAPVWLIVDLYLLYATQCENKPPRELTPIA